MPVLSNDDHLQKRTADNVCAACRKAILPGHRVHMTYICIDPDARNPNRITEKGMTLGIDMEFAHARCSDPFLNGTRL